MRRNFLIVQGGVKILRTSAAGSASPVSVPRARIDFKFVSWYDTNMTAEHDLSASQYRDLAEFRRQIRRFLHFSDVTAKEHGIEPQQHQLMLALHGLPDDVNPTIGELASRLYIQHHSAVELINRLEHTGAIVRRPGAHDKREVWVRLTPSGRSTLRKLALAHRTELERSGPELARTLNSILRSSKGTPAS